jgi:hypothetical protein
MSFYTCFDWFKEGITSIRLYTQGNPRNSNFFCYDIEKYIDFFKIRQIIGNKIIFFQNENWSLYQELCYLIVNVNKTATTYEPDDEGTTGTVLTAWYWDCFDGLILGLFWRLAIGTVLTACYWDCSDGLLLIASLQNSPSSKPSEQSQDRTGES